MVSGLAGGFFSALFSGLELGAGVLLLESDVLLLESDVSLAESDFSVSGLESLAVPAAVVELELPRLSVL